MTKKLNRYELAYKKIEDLVNVGGALEDKEETLKALKELVDLATTKVCRCGGIAETRWEPAESWCECSNCGEEIGFMSEYTGEYLYCPYCGQSLEIPNE